MADLTAQPHPSDIARAGKAMNFHMLVLGRFIAGLFLSLPFANPDTPRFYFCFSNHTSASRDCCRQLSFSSSVGLSQVSTSFRS